MLHSTVMPKKSLSPTTEAITMTPFTNRYGASFARNFTTLSSFQRRSSRFHSSGVGALAAYMSEVRDTGYELDDWRRFIIELSSAGIGVGDRSICGTRPVS